MSGRCATCGRPARLQAYRTVVVPGAVVATESIEIWEHLTGPAAHAVDPINTSPAPKPSRFGGIHSHG